MRENGFSIMAGDGHACVISLESLPGNLGVIRVNPLRADGALAKGEITNLYAANMVAEVQLVRLAIEPDLVRAVRE